MTYKLENLFFKVKACPSNFLGVNEIIVMLPLVHLSKCMYFQFRVWVTLEILSFTVGLVMYMRVCQSYKYLRDHCRGTIYKVFKLLKFRSLFSLECYFNIAVFSSGLCYCTAELQSSCRCLSSVRPSSIRLVLSEPVEQINAKFGGKASFHHVSRHFLCLFFKILQF